MTTLSMNRRNVLSMKRRIFYPDRLAHNSLTGQQLLSNFGKVGMKKFMRKRVVEMCRLPIMHLPLEFELRKDKEDRDICPQC